MKRVLAVAFGIVVGSAMAFVVLQRFRRDAAAKQQIVEEARKTFASFQLQGDRSSWRDHVSSPPELLLPPNPPKDGDAE